MKRAITHLLAVAMLVVGNFASANEFDVGGAKHFIIVTNNTDEWIMVDRRAPDGSKDSEWIAPGETKKVGFIPGATLAGMEADDGVRLNIEFHDGATYVVTKTTEWNYFRGRTTKYHVNVTLAPTPPAPEHELEKPLGISLERTDDGRLKVTKRTWGGVGHRLGLEVGDVIDGYALDRRLPYAPQTRHHRGITMLITLTYTDSMDSVHEIVVLKEHGIIELGV